MIEGQATIVTDQLTVRGLGEITVEAYQPGNDQYKAATPVQHKFNISKAILTAAANDQKITYGENIPELTIDISGFVLEESSSVIDEMPKATTIADNSSDAGNYGIAVSGGFDDHYEFAYVNGQLEIQKAVQEITVEKIDDKLTTDPDFSINATVNSGLSLTYKVLSGPATMNENVVSLTGEEGKVTLEVSQPGNINYKPASKQIFFNVILVDETRPSLSITSSAKDTVNEAFTIAIVFSEKVKEFSVDDISIENGTVKSLITSDNITFSAKIEPSLIGSVSIHISENKVTDMNGNGNTASDEFSLYFKGYLTSLEDDKNFSYKIYPNPARHFFILDADLKRISDDIQIIITDLKGGTVLIRKMNVFKDETIINLSGLTKGVYVVKIIDGSEIYSEKLIVN